MLQLQVNGAAQKEMVQRGIETLHLLLIVQQEKGIGALA
jgi:hypothetical protein